MLYLLVDPDGRIAIIVAQAGIGAAMAPEPLHNWGEFLTVAALTAGELADLPWHIGADRNRAAMTVDLLVGNGKWDRVAH